MTSPAAPLRLECGANRNGPCRGTSQAKNTLRRYRQPATQETVTLGVTILVFSKSVFVTGIQADARAN